MLVALSRVAPRRDSAGGQAQVGLQVVAELRLSSSGAAKLSPDALVWSTVSTSVLPRA